MRPDNFFRDKAHGQLLPTGDMLARQVHSTLLHAGRLAAQQVVAGRPIDLKPWVQALYSWAHPTIASLVRWGQTTKARELLLAIARAHRTKSLPGLVTKNIPSAVGGLKFGFDIYRPESIEFIKTATYEFAASTMATATREANEAIADLRRALESGVSRGETVNEVNRRLFEIFADPNKAARIGVTESSRAVHQGQLVAAQESGVVTGLKWLASSDACKLCLELNGKVVPLGRPFYVSPKGGPYAIVTAPPRHVNCQCAATEVIDPALARPDRIAALTHLMNGPMPKGVGYPTGIGMKSIRPIL